MPATALTDQELLARLVSFDTSSERSNVPLADFICNYLDRPGVLIVRQPSPDGTKLNLVISTGPAGPGRTGLTLSGHMDTVPPGNGTWYSEPFTLTRTADTWVGRGACDMKGFLALAINRFAEGRGLRAGSPLALLFTYDEELGTLGARRFVEMWPDPEVLPRSTVIGEPTSLEVVRMHKGHLKLRLTVAGIAAHSAYPHLGVNAIEAVAPPIAALTGLRQQMASETCPDAGYFDVPFPTLNLGMIQGGVAINVVPDRCIIDLGIRLLPGMTSAEMTHRVRQTVMEALGDHPFDLELIGDSPPMVLDEAAAINRTLCQLVNQHGARGVPFATDAGWLATIGMDCAVFGPGSIEVAHKPNEFLPIGEFERAGELLSELIHQACR